MPPGTLNENQFYEDVGNSEDIQRQQDNIKRGEIFSQQKIQVFKNQLN